MARRFVTLLAERRRVLEAQYGLDVRVSAIATRRHDAALDPAGIDLARAIQIVEAGGSLAVLHSASAGPAPQDTLEVIERHRDVARPGTAARVVIETTILNVEHGQPAISHIRAAIQAGAHVITANKGPVAIAYRDLRDAAAAAGVTFLFEGTVMDGIPIFNFVRETLPAVAVRGFRGVVNSTTNHILTAMEHEKDFAEALAEMQAAGIAEADATLDVDGWDAAAKTAALVNVLMDGEITPAQIDRTGITQVSAADVRAALGSRRRIRLVASATRVGEAVDARVQPMELSDDDPLARLSGVANALFLRTDLLGEIGITQMDGGLTQTAYALLSDLVALRARLESPPAAPARRIP